MIIINLDVMMAKRKMSLGELSEKVGITLANLSILKNNKAKVLVGLCKGKKLYDKREDAAKKDAQRAIERSLREKN